MEGDHIVLATRLAKLASTTSPWPELRAVDGR